MRIMERDEIKHKIYYDIISNLFVDVMFRKTEDDLKEERVKTNIEEALTCYINGFYLGRFMKFCVPPSSTDGLYKIKLGRDSPDPKQISRIFRNQKQSVFPLRSRFRTIGDSGMLAHKMIVFQYEKMKYDEKK